MRRIFVTKQFKRDAKKHVLAFITPNWAEVLWKLLVDEALPTKYADHQLTGNLSDFRDCHIKPDLVLIYRKVDDDIHFSRIGTHSELDL